MSLHTRGQNCETCEGFCHYALDTQQSLREQIAETQDALRDLVAVKQMREEVSRRKQRRRCSIMRDPDEVKAVAKMHQDCKAREFRAWNTARAIVANLPPLKRTP